MRTIGNGIIRRVGQGVATGEGQSKNIDDWRLATNDDAATVEAVGYFNQLATHSAVGSFIWASLDLDGAPVGKTYMITAIAANVVTVAVVVAV